jgi:hypothetical protein
LLDVLQHAGEFLVDQGLVVVGHLVQGGVGEGRDGRDEETEPVDESRSFLQFFSMFSTFL